MFGNTTTPRSANGGATPVPTTPTAGQPNGSTPSTSTAGPPPSLTTASGGAPPADTAVAANNTVTIVVKNVYRNTSIQLHVPVSAALGSIKEAIRENFEERPAPEQQRLIYLGKVCSNDSIPLRDILLPSRPLDARNPQTFHLVLGNGASRLIPSSSSSTTPIRPSFIATSRPTSTSTSSAVAEGVERRISTQQVVEEQQSPQPQPPAQILQNIDVRQPSLTGLAGGGNVHSLGAEGLRQRRPPSHAQGDPSVEQGPRLLTTPTAASSTAATLDNSQVPSSEPSRSPTSVSTPPHSVGVGGAPFTSSPYTPPHHLHHHHQHAIAAQHYYHAYAAYAHQQHMYMMAAFGAGLHSPYYGLSPTHHPHHLQQQQHHSGQMYSPYAAHAHAQAGVYYSPYHQDFIDPSFTAGGAAYMHAPPSPPHYGHEEVAPPTSTTITPSVGQAPPAVLPRRTTFITMLADTGRAVFQLLDWTLAAKIVMLIFLLNPGDPQRLACLVSLSVVAYLYQTGILGLLLGPAFGRPRNPLMEDEAAGAAAAVPPPPAENLAADAQQPPAIEGAAVPLPAQQPIEAATSPPQAVAVAVGRVSWTQAVTNKARALCNGTVPIEASYALDLVVFFASFLLSLFPTWVPTAAPRPTPPVEEVPPPQPQQQQAAIMAN